MVMKKEETSHAGSFILSEANFHRSRENVTIKSGQDLKAGAVLGKVTADGKYIAFDNDAGTGAETAAGILIHDCDASDGDVQAAIIARDAEVIDAQLVWAASEDDSDKAAGRTELETLGIQVR